MIEVVMSVDSTGGASGELEQDGEGSRDTVIVD